MYNDISFPEALMLAIAYSKKYAITDEDANLVPNGSMVISCLIAKRYLYVLEAGVYTLTEKGVDAIKYTLDLYDELFGR